MKKRASVKRLIVGVTGIVGSGKSTVSAMLAGRGGFLIDADRIGHRLLAPGGAARSKVAAVFGTADRKKLGRMVFACGKAAANSGITALSRLNRIMHPLILKAIRRKIAACRTGLVVLDAPLLFETGLQKAVDATVVVSADRRRRYARLRRLRGFSRQRTERITAFQMPLEKKIRLADFVIDNNGSKAKTRKQVEELRRNVWRS